MNRPVHVLVVGSGIFGVWTALELLRRGARVTLLDAWGAGHARSSSGGDTRIIRATYGSHAIYTRMARRALERWQAHESQMAGGAAAADRGGVAGGRRIRASRDASAATLAAEGLPFEELIVARCRRRYPQMAFEGMASRVDGAAGRIPVRAPRVRARRGTGSSAEGGTCRVAAAASPVSMDADGVSPDRRWCLEADAFVFACGPWLGDRSSRTSSETIVRPTRQEVYYFGTPAGDARFLAVPAGLAGVWARFIYGIPDRRWARVQGR